LLRNYPAATAVCSSRPTSNYTKTTFVHIHYFLSINLQFELLTASLN